MCKYKTREISKGYMSAIKAAVKEGCVVERPELSGNFMQIFSNNGNILKRTYRKDTKQWGSISVCRSLNWMGSKVWYVIQDENGRDLRFGGDTSSFKVLPPFMLRGCECEQPEEELPAEEEVAEPEPQAEEPVHLELPPAEKVSAIMQAVHKVARRYGIPDRDVMTELTEIQKAHQFKDIDEAIAQFEKDMQGRKTAKDSYDGLRMISELLSGRPMWMDGLRLKMEDGVLRQREGEGESHESSLTLNDLLASRMEYDDYPLFFDDATVIMEQSRWCRSEVDGRMYTISEDRLVDSCGSAGIPMAVLGSKWRVCGE